jgi:membrane protein required for colicin V production
MTGFDYIVLFVLVCSVLISTMRGLIKEILSLAGWVVGFLLANAYADWLANLLPSVIPEQGRLRVIVAFLILLIGVKLMMGLLAAAIGAILKATGLTIVDRGLGGLFGLARGLVLVLVAVIIGGMTALVQEPFWKNAVLRPLAETGARTALPYLPGDMARLVKF